MGDAQAPQGLGLNAPRLERRPEAEGLGLHSARSRLRRLPHRLWRYVRIQLYVRYSVVRYSVVLVRAGQIRQHPLSGSGSGRFSGSGSLGMFTRLAAPRPDSYPVGHHLPFRGNHGHRDSFGVCASLGKRDTDNLVWLVQVINDRLHWRCTSRNLDICKSITVVAESSARVINAPFSEQDVLDNDSDSVPSATRAQCSPC
jgi:hypothetical protein